jgi:hypothetical protein
VIEANGGEVVFEEYYPIDQAEYSATISKIRDSTVDCVLHITFSRRRLRTKKQLLACTSRQQRHCVGDGAAGKADFSARVANGGCHCADRLVVANGDDLDAGGDFLADVHGLQETPLHTKENRARAWEILGDQPEVPLPAKGTVERGLMRIDTTQHWPRLMFTETGLMALRTMMTDRRLADPERCAHIPRNSASHRVPVHRPETAVDEDTGVDRGAISPTLAVPEVIAFVQVRQRRGRSPFSGCGER